MATLLAPAPTAAAAAAATPAADDQLPRFNTNEAQLRKVENRNTLVFSVPVRSSVLLQLKKPRSHSYEERDLRWLHLLQAIAVVPSTKDELILKLVHQAMVMVSPPRFRIRLEQMLRPLVDELSKPEDLDDSCSVRALLTLRLKEKVASFLREWIADPVEGFVLRRDHVIGGMYLDDLVATPLGVGYLRGHRRQDGFCIIVYPWGHGFVLRRHVEPLADAIVHQRSKRRHNEFLALEHQHLFEQVGSLLSHYPEEQDGSQVEGVVTREGVNVSEYRQLLETLRDECALNSEELQHDLSFVRRVQALAIKLRLKRPRMRSNSQDDDMEEDGDEGDGDENENENEEDDGDVLGGDDAGEKSKDDDVAEKDDQQEAEDMEVDEDGGAGERL